MLGQEIWGGEPATHAALMETLGSSGVVCITAPDGEILCELYSLLEWLEPEEEHLTAGLRYVRLIPQRTADLGLYLLYTPLYDALTHFLPAGLQSVSAVPGAVTG